MRAKPKVRTPNLPINMRSEIMILLTVDNFPVIPVESPTVLRAEDTSKRICSNEKLSPSVNNIAQVPMISITV